MTFYNRENGDVQPDLPMPPDQQPPVPVVEPPDRPRTGPDGPVDDPGPKGPVRQ